MNIIDKAKAYATHCHRDCNHLYDRQPYELHLQMVVGIAERFIHLVPQHERDNVIAACWVHDTIEDCRQTFNDVKTATNLAVAELAYAVTNEKGRTRAERANSKYYEGIRNTPNATFVKLCDRIANVQYSIEAGNRHKLEMYRKESKDFEKKLFDESLTEMFDHLGSLFNSTTNS